MGPGRFTELFLEPFPKRFLELFHDGFREGIRNGFCGASRHRQPKVNTQSLRASRGCPGKWNKRCSRNREIVLTRLSVVVVSTVGKIAVSPVQGWLRDQANPFEASAIVGIISSGFRIGFRQDLIDPIRRLSARQSEDAIGAQVM